MRISLFIFILVSIAVQSFSFAQNYMDIQAYNWHGYQYESIHDDILPPASVLRIQALENDYLNDTIDADEGAVDTYDKFNPAMGGDSVRYKEPGVKYSGWYLEYYPNGRVRHKGYYEAGKLVKYKNFYSNGWIERVFRTKRSLHSEMKKYFSNAVLKQRIQLYSGKVYMETDYYMNGKMEYFEENELATGNNICWKYFFTTGDPKSITELANADSLKYKSREYWDNGNIKEEGNIVYNKELKKYQKDGKWRIYTTSGRKLGEEFYAKGILVKEIKYP
jgi:antitoxin component YwqK of YwqJK toxin-antitoxin module